MKHEGTGGNCPRTLAINYGGSTQIQNTVVTRGRSEAIQRVGSVQKVDLPLCNIYVLAGPVQIAQLLVIGNPLYYCLCLILLQVLNFYPVGVE